LSFARLCRQRTQSNRAYRYVGPKIKQFLDVYCQSPPDEDMPRSPVAARSTFCVGRLVDVLRSPALEHSDSVARAGIGAAVVNALAGGQASTLEICV
jgi:hypothetical protein